MNTSDLTVQPLPSTAGPRRLDRAPFEWRALKSGFLTGLTWVMALLASIPLFSVIYMLVIQGGSRLDWEAITALPPSAFEMGGGFGNAIVGTLTMVGIATLISVPIGLFAAIYLSILDPDSKLAHTARFLAKVLTGFPSILAGVFVYAAMVVTMKSYSALAGGVALAVLMLPTVVLAAEQAMTTVPKKMKDAAFGMGCTRAQVIWKVVLPTGMPRAVAAATSTWVTVPLQAATSLSLSALSNTSLKTKSASTTSNSIFWPWIRSTSSSADTSLLVSIQFSYITSRLFSSLTSFF